MKSAKEILDVGIGGFTTMRMEFLRSAAKPNGALIPRNWTSNCCYEELERDGLVLEILNTERVSFHRHWVTTIAGRRALSPAERPDTEKIDGSQS
jgi:hypothetical protein